jgi:UDP-2,3-diacylglucosamine hydrolase
MTLPPLASTREPVGLVAGAGGFPIHVAQRAHSFGIPVVCVGLPGMADPILRDYCTTFRPLWRFSIGAIIRTFQRHGVKRWTMAGKVHKHLFMRPWRWFQFIPDWRAVKIWYSRQAKDRKDDTLLLRVIDEFHSEGLECVSALELCPELLVKPGHLTKRIPSAKELADIRFGWEIAKEMGRLDVGQSVMVREKVTIAVEAIEGTDQAILRAGQVCGNAAFVVVKVAKPQQDMRFDVPTIGPTTIETMRAAGGKVLAIEANKTIFLEEATTLALAEKYGISITALSDQGIV